MVAGLKILSESMAMTGVRFVLGMQSPLPRSIATVQNRWAPIAAILCAGLIQIRVDVPAPSRTSKWRPSFKRGANYD